VKRRDIVHGDAEKRGIVLVEKFPGDIVAGPLRGTTGVQAAGTKEITTFFCPRNCRNATVPPRTARSGMNLRLGLTTSLSE